MTDKISLGIDIAYDRITGTVLTPAQQYPCQPDGKKFLVPSILYNNNVRTFGDVPYKTDASTTYLKNLVDNAENIEKTTVNMYNKEYTIVDEIPMQWFMMKFEKEAQTRGILTQTVVSVPSSSNLISRKRIAQSAKMANLPNVQVISSAILPFVSIQNFDKQIEMMGGKRQSYIFVDVNTEEITFVFGFCGREENQREVVVEKVQVVDIGFTKVIDIIREYIKNKHLEAIEEENDQDSESPLSETSVNENLGKVIENLMTPEVDSFSILFEDKDTVDATVEIVRSELEEELQDIIIQITEKLKEFLNMIKEEYNNELCIVEYTGYYSRFKIIEKQMSTLLTEYGHRVRNTSDREAIRAEGCAIAGGLKMENEFDIAPFEIPKLSHLILNRKAHRFFFNIFMRETELKVVKVVNGSEEDRVELPYCYFNVLKDCYEVNMELEDVEDGENKIEIEFKGQPILSCKYTINKNELLLQQNELKGSEEKPQHNITIRVYLDLPDNEHRKIVVEHSVVYASNIIFYQPVEYTSTVIPHELLDVELETMWKEQTEMMETIYNDETEYEDIKRTFSYKKSEYQRRMKENKQFETLKNEVVKYNKEKQFNKETLDKLLALEKKYGFSN